jgi:LppX_LprAFG lipoprotein
MRRKTTLRRAAAALVLPVALTAMSACGSDEPAGSSKAADPGVEEGEEIEAGEFIDTMSESLENATTAHVTLEGDGQLAMTMEGDVDYDSDPPSSSLTMKNEMLGDQEMSVVMVDGVMYMQMGELSGGKYFKMDLSGEDNSILGQDMSQQLDPSKALRTMEKSIKTVTYVGEEKVDGEDLDRYTVIIDSAAMVGEALGEDAPPESGLAEEIAYDIWFDDDGRFARTTMDMGETAGTMTMTMSDWGKDVDIEAPPADQVTDMPSMPTMPEAPNPQG